MTDNEFSSPHLTRKEMKLIKLLRMQSDEFQLEILDKIGIVQNETIQIDIRQSKK